MTRVVQFVAVKIPQQERTEMWSRIARLGVAADYKLLLPLELEFEPVARAHPGRVAGAGPFRHDPLPACSCGATQQRGAIHAHDLSQLQ